MKALITGITGFVGTHLSLLLKNKGWDVEGTTRQSRENHGLWKVDLQNQEQLIKAIKGSKPTHIFHLAGLSDVRKSWDFPHEYLRTNAIGTYNVLDAVRKVNPKIRVVTVGSSEEYGIGAQGIVDENQLLRPLSPYGISKSTAGMYSVHFARSYHIHVVHVRPFNHIGPGQREGFAAADFAKQIARINKYKELPAVISIGNLESIRDFTDVRDIAEAYYQLSIKGESGEIYNVASGRGVKIKDLLSILLSYSSRKIQTIVDDSRLRPADIPLQIGNCNKLKQATGWKSAMSIENTLKEIYEDWQSRV
ncbi:GDP-mannose 4,6-dehydratase [Fictibacillus fluitans]|uniref:GDP-mannose 4,6-dehydratase n=1 Tax=Fictibacillus fluitans TaxID=3058422 RepID=A0ABT8HTL5_9BACL|nr:GDP-mannose 4,6-dehydratase [Fictibacillus sp. NE201]MDN4523622.1 GDP-mannose 4,6-dehydratase [Fictibacillus sp. NE201]